MPSDTIKVKVVFFASAKAAAGVDEWQAELPEGAKTTALGAVFCFSAGAGDQIIGR